MCTVGARLSADQIADGHASVQANSAPEEVTRCKIRGRLVNVHDGLQRCCYAFSCVGHHKNR